MERFSGVCNFKIKLQISLLKTTKNLAVNNFWWCFRWWCLSFTNFIEQESRKNANEKSFNNHMFYLYVFSLFFSFFSIHFILDDPLPLGLSEVYPCRKCNRIYARKYTRSRHERLECGIDAQFECPFCNFRAKHKHNLKSHISKAHSKRLVEHGLYSFDADD